MENNFPFALVAVAGTPTESIQEKKSAKNQVELQIQAFYEMWNGFFLSPLFGHLFVCGMATREEKWVAYNRIARGKDEKGKNMIKNHIDTRERCMYLWFKEDCVHSVEIGQWNQKNLC